MLAKVISLTINRIFVTSTSHALFLYFCDMAEISISNKDWPRIKIKLQRKYNHLTNEELQYTEGEEDSLIGKLAGLVNRERSYIVFTLKKALVNIDNNRL